MRDHIASGRRVVTDGAVALIDGNRSLAPILVRYWRQSQRNVERQFAERPGADGKSLALKLAKVEADRRLDVTAADIEHALKTMDPNIAPAASLDLARKIYRWRTEILRDRL